MTYDCTFRVLKITIFRLYITSLRKSMRMNVASSYHTPKIPFHSIQFVLLEKTNFLPFPDTDNSSNSRKLSSLCRKSQKIVYCQNVIKNIDYCKRRRKKTRPTFQVPLLQVCQQVSYFRVTSDWLSLVQLFLFLIFLLSIFQ